VLWIENNTGCQHVCSRVPAQSMRSTPDPALCSRGHCWDEVLLKGLDDRLKAIKSDTVIVLHMIGSRGPAYYRRYPDRFKRFTPTCDTASIETCPRELIVNSYDNSILYTDYVLARVIDALRSRTNLNSAMLFTSGHGQSLGERGIYLHGLPFMIAPDTQTKVPMLLWLSPGLQRNISYQCLRNAAGKPASHDNVFHSVMGLLGITSSVYDPKLDLITPCRGR
ncbi:MAG: sulfatase-like hydrolase/transferase, partial [Alphaproteobacteria bacterium]|nr:sulfatase-like hydrolase/transferase [Alphaproteobacteria bacterium]